MALLVREPVTRSGTVTLRIEPRLEHEHAPKPVRVIATSGLVLPPGAADHCCIEMAIALDPSRIEQRLRPLPEPSTQPRPHRNTESPLGTFEQGPRHVAVE